MPVFRGVWLSLYGEEMLLTEEQTRDFETVAAYLERLTKTHGIKLLGSGYFSRVYTHPTEQNMVVKVFAKADEDAVDYLKFCMDHPKNPWCPHVYSLHKVKYSNSENWIAFIEKLKPAIKKQVNDWDLVILESLPQSVRDALESYDGVFSLLKCNSLDLQLVAQKTRDKQLAEVLEFISKYATDIHLGNVMIRQSDNQLVFSDPIASDFD